jgi:hypothetical protein
VLALKEQRLVHGSDCDQIAKHPVLVKRSADQISQKMLYLKEQEGRTSSSFKNYNGRTKEWEKVSSSQINDRWHYLKNTGKVSSSGADVTMIQRCKFSKEEENELTIQRNPFMAAVGNKGSITSSAIKIHKKTAT